MAKKVGRGKKGKRPRKPPLHVVSDMGTSKSMLSKHGSKKSSKTISKGSFGRK